MVSSVAQDQGVHAGSMWENQLQGDLRNSYNIGENSERKLDMKSMNQNKGTNEGVVPLNRKQNQGGVVVKSGNNMENGKGKDGKYRDSHDEMPIRNERERGKKTRDMFANLHALLPDLPSKVDKSTILDATVKEIKNLKQILENLEKKKQEKLKYMSQFVSESSSTMSSLRQVDFQTWPSQNVVLNICGGEAQFSICATKKPCILTTIAFVLEKHMIDVVSVNIMYNGNGNFYTIQVHARQGSYDTNSMEEAYKQAAEEIMKWIS